MLVAKGSELGVAALKAELGNLTDIQKWHFVYASESQIKDYFASLKTDLMQHWKRSMTILTSSEYLMP